MNKFFGHVSVTVGVIGPKADANLVVSESILFEGNHFANIRPFNVKHGLVTLDDLKSKRLQPDDWLRPFWFA